MVASGGNANIYDGHNKRVKTQDSTGTHYAFYSRSGQLIYRNANGNHTDYYYLGKKLVAKRKAAPPPTPTATTWAAP